MKLETLIDALQRIAPTRLAEAWDNVGLLVGDPAQNITGVMLAIDYTPEVADEARAAGCDLIVAYHPPIFTPLKRLTADSLIYDAIRRGVAIYSPHTALDVADGGTNDLLADAIGLTSRAPLRLQPAQPSQYKLVVFVPPAQLETLSRALFATGAGGDIGNYSQCSFRSPGTGTFFGEAGSHPAIGKSGQLEQVDEVRLETLVPIAKVDAVIRALRANHPYEEPAFDLIQLAAVAQPIGQGRVGDLPPTDRPALIQRIKRELELSHVLVAGPQLGQVSRAAVGAGSCGDMLNDAIAAKVQLYLTGEMRHHDAIKAANAGMTVVCTLHSNSERAVLKRVQKKLAEAAGGIPVRISQRDRDPFVVA